MNVNIQKLYVDLLSAMGDETPARKRRAGRKGEKREGGYSESGSFQQRSDPDGQGRQA